MKFKRVVVIAPTRSTCLNISVVLDNGTIPQTLLMQEKGKEIFEAVDHLNEGGFGVVAGTGTGKTVAIRDIARRVLGKALQVDVVTRENEATDYTWTCNVLVVTPGVALNWLKSYIITGEDLVVMDEIHQTSEHLELSMALAKRNGNTFIWMSATIDPAVYASYLKARTVIYCSAFDPSRRAEVSVAYGEAVPFLEKQVESFIQEKRAVAVFVSTRAQAENLAKRFGEHESLTCDFYHGGEKAEKLRQFLKGEVPKPFMIFMTSAGASSLNIAGLDTVVIVDEMFTQVVHSGVAVLEKVRLGNNELLQMGGRVNGRAFNGKIFILSARSIDFHTLKPTVPEFVLGGDLQHVALVCARLGVGLGDLDIITYLDRGKYEVEVKRFKARGVIGEDNNLTDYGSEIERLPVTPAWAEVLVHARKAGDAALLNTAIVAASTESLFSLIRKEAKLGGIAVSGSDHLTGYNIVATALRQFGMIRQDDDGVCYAFRGDFIRKQVDRKTRQERMEKGEFIEWCDQNGFSNKAIKEATIAMKSVFRQMNMRLPVPDAFKPAAKGGETEKNFVELLARVQSLDFVQDERNSHAGTVWAAQHSSTYARSVLGTIRFWKDKRGFQRATVEGTEVPDDTLMRYAAKEPVRVFMADADGVSLEYSVVFCGERLSSASERIADDAIPTKFQGEAERAFLRWLVTQMATN